MRWTISFKIGCSTSDFDKEKFRIKRQGKLQSIGWSEIKLKTVKKLEDIYADKHNDIVQDTHVEGVALYPNEITLQRSLFHRIYSLFLNLHIYKIKCCLC